jgi:hypothetical protein
MPKQTHDSRLPGLLALVLIVLACSTATGEEGLFQFQAQPIFGNNRRGGETHGALAGRIFPVRVKLRTWGLAKGSFRAWLGSSKETVTVVPVEVGQGEFEWEILVRIRGMEASQYLHVGGELNGKKLKPIKIDLNVMQPEDEEERDNHVAAVLWINARGLLPQSLPACDKRTIHLAVPVEEMPRDWRAYFAVDAVVLGRADWDGLDTSRLLALHTWVRVGGRIVVHGGTSFPEPRQAWRAWLDARPTAPAMEATSALIDELLNRQVVDEENLDRIPCRDLVVEKSTVSGSRGPLFALAPLGLGSVAATALDIESSLLRKRYDFSSLLAGALMGRFMEVVDQGEETDRYRRVRYRRTWVGPSWGDTVVNMVEVEGLPFWAVAVFALVYILLVGPGDYLLVRLLGRPILTWVTTIATIIVFSMIAHFVMREMRGTKSILTLVEVRDGGEGVDRRTFFGAFFPESAGSRTLSAEGGILFEPGIFEHPDRASFTGDGGEVTFSLPVWAGMGLAGVKLDPPRQGSPANQLMLFRNGWPQGLLEVPDGPWRAVLLLYRGNAYPGRWDPSKGVTFTKSFIRIKVDSDEEEKRSEFYGLDALDGDHFPQYVTEDEVGLLRHLVLSSMPEGSGALSDNTRNYLSSHYLPRRVFSKDRAVLLLLGSGEGGVIVHKEKIRRKHIVLERYELRVREEP